MQKTKRTCAVIRGLFKVQTFKLHLIFNPRYMRKILNNFKHDLVALSPVGSETGISFHWKIALLRMNILISKDADAKSRVIAHNYLVLMSLQSSR